MATFWCPSCEATFQQDALSEEGIACPHCQTELHPIVKVADISALRGQPEEFSAAGRGTHREVANTDVGPRDRPR
jgi:transcription initiation factor IIE alpha subunit